DKKRLRSEIKGNLNRYKKIFIWLPTWRKSFIVPAHSDDGQYVDNVFQVKDFDAEEFNSILKDKNSLCIIKPHPYSNSQQINSEFSNILIIDDKWLWEQGITLYHLVGCTDVLISDVSS